MSIRPLPLALACLSALSAAACQRPGNDAVPPAAPAAAALAEGHAAQHRRDYVTVPLTADLSGFDARGKEMIALLVQASEVMDSLYWQQSSANGAALLDSIQDPATREFARLNFGPWDRLNDNHPFVAGFGPRPPGATFYPVDMTKDEFEAASLPDKASWYTLLRRDDSGKLVTVPYHVAYRADLEKAAALLRRAAPLSSDAAFGNYLRMRADALLSDDFQPSDLAWMDMKTNPVDIVIGPIETYEDELFGYKASYEGLVLIKDIEWSKKLARFAALLPEMQRGLPVEARYKAEKPGANADLNAYFAIHYGGNANMGAKTIAINLPNDEQVQLKKGTRRLQLENVMQAKFDNILLPIAKVLIAQDQLQNVTFEAFFEDTMFHEVAHGLGIKNTLDGKQTVTNALKEYASSFEEGKADVLGLYLITALSDKGELDKSKLMDGYVTFLAGILRSVRFGAGDSHGKANMVRFHFFEKMGAFTRDPATGRYRVEFEKMKTAMNALSERLLTIQGDGDYAAAKQMTDTMGVISPELAADLKRLKTANIPVDVRFKQGLEVLGLAAPVPVAAAAPGARERLRGKALMGKDGFGINLCGEPAQRIMRVDASAKAMLDQFLAGGAHEFFVDGWGTRSDANGVQVNAFERLSPDSDPCDDDLSAKLFMARGTEPFWSVDVTRRQLSLQRPDAAPVVGDVSPAAQENDASTISYKVGTPEGALSLELKRETCSDGMSDMLYGWTASASFAGQTYRGCAYAGTDTPRQ